MAKNICFALLFLGEALIAWLYLEYLFERKRKTSFIAISFLVGYVVLFAASFADNTAINVALFCLVNFVLIVLNYSCGVKTAIVHSALLSFLMTIAEILIALLISLFGHEFAAYTYNFTVMVALVVMSKMLYLVMSLVGARIFKPHKRSFNEPKLMALFCGMPLLSTILGIIIIYIGSHSELNTATGVMIVVNVFSLLAVNLIFLVLYNQYQRANDERLELELSMQKEAADTNYYQSLLEQYENQRILVHDIRNHLHTIGTLARQARSAEIEKYVKSIDIEYAPSKQVKLCRNSILNVFLIQFTDKCCEQNVDFHCDIRDLPEEFLDAPSITALFGNLLTNSLEAAQASTDKCIELSVTCNPSHAAVVISVVNSCDTTPIPDGNGRFLSKKKDALHHGVGLKSIERIVEKNNGIASMYYDKESCRFHHIIQLPVATELSSPY